MQLKINTSITLSTGNSASASILELFNEKFLLSQAQFTCDLKVWKSQADKDSGKDHCYLFNSERITNLSYAIPQADLDQATTDGHFGIIGTNHVDNIKDALATALGIVDTDIEVTSLV